MIKSGGCRVLKRATAAPVVRRRTFFDYLAAKKAAATAPATTGEGGSGAATKAPSAKDFSWGFLDWYRDENPVFVEQLEKLRAHMSYKDKYCLEPTRPYSKIDFADWKAKIKDPTFVDEVEADFQSKIDIAESFTDNWQPFTWSKEAQEEHRRTKREEYTKFGVEPPRAGDLDSREKIEQCWKDMVGHAAEMDRQFDAAFKEYTLDYEQLEAERDMYGARGEMMDYAEHPTHAEMTEEMYAGKQTFNDKVLYEFEYSRFTKRERLMQLRDENARKLFLQNWREQVIIHGCDSSVGGSDA